MKPLDQCPSTKGKLDPKAQSQLAGRAYWRSVEDFAAEPGFDEFLHREFPAGASELMSSSRRDFMKLMGASLALAGAATIPGCRRPDHKIMPYSAEVPEEVIPGRPLYYATAMPLPGGGAEGLLVETHGNRPTKIEGNPLHPINQGKSSLLAQASILTFYDPERLTDPKTSLKPDEADKPRSWTEFDEWAGSHFTRFDGTQGRGLAFILDKKTSPTRDALKSRIMQRWPRATWISYDPVAGDSLARGAEVAFGRAHREVRDLSKAKRILSIGCDFLGFDGSLADARGYARWRKPANSGDEMSRVYAVETAFTSTGASADHRLALAPSEMSAYVVRLASKVASSLGAMGAGLDQPITEALLGQRTVDSDAYSDAEWIDAVAQDLIDHRGESIIIAGPSLAPEAQALVHAMNAALGAVGATVRYLPMTEDEVSASPDQLANLARDIRSGAIDTIVAIDANPVFEAPADVDMKALWATVPTTVTLSLTRNETEAASTWSLPGAHFLEAWGDAEAADGSRSITQPMIAPLYGGRSDIELLAALAGEDHPHGHDLVRGQWRTILGAGNDRAFEKAWRRALHDGQAPRARTAERQPTIRAAAVADGVRRLNVSAKPGDNSFDVLFTQSHLYGGRFAGNGWLQELPHTGTRVVWDNPALISPATAERLGLEPEPFTEKEPEGRLARIELNGHAMEIPVWIMPGMPDNTIVLQLGYGRDVCGRVGGDESLDHKVGFNTYKVRPAGVALAASGAKLTPSRGSHFIATTQNHWSLESRTAVVRQLDKKWWDKHAAEFEAKGGTKTHVDTGYGTETQLNLAEKMGELSHAPPNESIYENPYNATRGDPDPQAKAFDGNPPKFATGQQWGMTIDLSSCTGCGVCSIACQSENNIPIVGKKESAKGREMQWIRVDRYYYGDSVHTGHDDPADAWKTPAGMVHQPVACVQCENAPCETVCPVNATVHGPEGINYMVYNRCIGTRYCANNCPYKVRRFNFFDYGVKKFNGDFIGDDVGRPDNVNLIPPRLRQHLTEIEKMQKNPDVTVRSRGVMEKCTYCIQRINESRIEARIKNMPKIPDGMFQVACQQACPTDSIVFGDLRDEDSRVKGQRDGQRSYLLLGYLNTRPRTSHLIRVVNPNPAMISAERADHDPLAHGSHGGEGGHGDDHGNGHGDEAHGDGHASAIFNRSKAAADQGYALSLRILNTTGIHA